MKLFTHIAALFLTAATLAGTTVAAQAGTPTSTVIKNVTKIEVSGNIALTLVQSANEQIRTFDAKKLQISQEGSVLKINAPTSEKVVVQVSLQNLLSITAADRASVVTCGRFNLVDLSVQLSGYATADINTSTIFLRSSVNDFASLTLSGTSTQYAGTLSAGARVSLQQFKSDQTWVSSRMPVFAAAK